ncbi:Tn3 family transposase [Streptomyces sp. NPDC006430]|uniref:Tn3 family transposase n=1 Tax=Streptomyces sp. NPDC006430 TaxID=3154299 RepID=UPI0033AA573C
MIEGVLRHCTDVEIDRQYTGTHGASIVGFAFAHMLGFNLLPRLKNVGSARLYRPAAGEDEKWPNLAPVLATDDLFYGKDGDLTGSDKESQEDRRALSPLFWTHVNPYGRFELDMNSHLALATTASMVPGPRTVPEAEAARSAADSGSGSAS